MAVSLLLSRKFIINFYDIRYEEWLPCIAVMSEGLKAKVVLQPSLRNKYMGTVLLQEASTEDLVEPK